MAKELVDNIFRILKIRVKQSCRIFLQIGVIYMILIAIIIVVVGVSTYISLTDLPKTCYISAFWLLIIAFIHSRRKDYTFLLLSMKFPRAICGTEYVLLSVPLAILLLINSQYLIAIILLASTFSIGFLKIKTTWKRKTLNTFLQQLIPNDMYEWKAGIRKSFFPILIFWLLGLSLSFFVASVPIALFFIGIIMIDFYDKNESWQMLISFEKRPQALLMHKIKEHTLSLLILFAPLILAFMLFHSAYWHIPLVELVILLSIHIYAIISKYALYSHSDEQGSSAYLLIGTLIGLFPVTTPILWIASIFLFFKARNNLNTYLHDYN